MKKGFQLCTVVQGKNLDIFIENLRKAQTAADMVELRADSIKDFELADIARLKKLVKVPAIFTFRHKKEGGLFTGTVAKQKEVIKKAFELGFTYVDVAYDNPIIKELGAKERKQLLSSYHCYDGTPSMKELESLVSEMRSVKPAIVKIATLVKEWSDIGTLIDLLKIRENNEKLVVIGMGEKGEITRLTFPSMGSYIAFVTMKKEEAIAPGMLTPEDFGPITKYFSN